MNQIPVGQSLDQLVDRLSWISLKVGNTVCNILGLAAQQNALSPLNVRGIVPYFDQEEVVLL